jgi:2,4-dienoyl-CoA reductase-like NADH-dependent reductase (Old Yellow Enzyme family)
MLNFIPEAMTNERVWEVIDEFGDAAVRAKKAGADGVEVHGAHGYLVAQFMSPHANKRTDEFGGDFFGRMKFPQEVFKNIRSKVGDDYPLLFRFGHDEKVNGGRTLEEVARALGKEVYVIGDASQPGPANKATEAALDAVLKLG